MSLDIKFCEHEKDTFEPLPIFSFLAESLYCKEFKGWDYRGATFGTDSISLSFVKDGKIRYLQVRYMK